MLALLGVLIPRAVMPVYQKEWDGQEADVAYYATQRAKSIGGPAQKFARQRIQVVAIEPDPTGCAWGYRVPVSGIVTVRFYTFFGIPQATWVISCSSEQRVWGP